MLNWKRISELSITKRLRFAKNAEMTVENPNGTTSTVSIGELAKLDAASQVTILTAASTLTAAQSGSTLVLNSATEFATTLPAPSLGLRYRFILTVAPILLMVARL